MQTKLLNRAIKCIRSCTTKEQLDTANQYCSLVERRYRKIGGNSIDTLLYALKISHELDDLITEQLKHVS